MTPAFQKWLKEKTEALKKISEGVRELEKTPDVTEYLQFSPAEGWQCVLFRGIVLSLGSAVNYTRHSLEQAVGNINEISGFLGELKKQKDQVRKALRH